MHGWQANLKRTCAQPVPGRAMPENEIPPAMRVDIYCMARIKMDTICAKSAEFVHLAQKNVWKFSVLTNCIKVDKV